MLLRAVGKIVNQLPNRVTISGHTNVSANGRTADTASAEQGYDALKRYSRDLTEAELAYELERLTIDLEERSLDERADYIASALAEAEQARPEEPGARDSIDQLLRESQALNEQRKSLHRRRDQTRLLARPTPVRA